MSNCHLVAARSLIGRAAVVAGPLAARAQQGERMRRIGVLMHWAADDAEGQACRGAYQFRFGIILHQRAGSVGLCERESYLIARHRKRKLLRSARPTLPQRPYSPPTNG
jgi:hypothetical protein